MDKVYLISQIFGTIALIITLYAYHLKTKKGIFKTMCIANIMDIIHYILLNAYSGCGIKTIAFFRNIFIIKKESNQKLNKTIYLIIFLSIYVLLGIFTYQNIYSLLPIFAALLYMVVIWNGNEKKVKKIAFICYFLWLAYNIAVHSISGVISNIISLISTYIAYKNAKRSK